MRSLVSRQGASGGKWGGFGRPPFAYRGRVAEAPEPRRNRARRWLIQQFYRFLQDHVPLQRFVRSGDVNGNVRRYAHGFEEFAIG